jgi:hypothetical protein
VVSIEYFASFLWRWGRVCKMARKIDGRTAENVVYTQEVV